MNQIVQREGRIPLQDLSGIAAWNGTLRTRNHLKTGKGGAPSATPAPTPMLRSRTGPRICPQPPNRCSPYEEDEEEHQKCETIEREDLRSARVRSWP